MSYYSLKTEIVAYENKNFGDNRGENRGENRNESLFSKRIKAGKRRTYFFDVRSTRGNDYFITITESKKRFDDNGYDRHKMFLYKEDFNKFLAGLTDTINYVKTDLMPDFDFDAFNHDQENEDGSPMSSVEGEAAEVSETTEVSEPITMSAVSEVAGINDNSSVDDWKM
ncbi:MAG: DNA-binding protein [Flavipsychrobacter sp.]|nr:DNA-binding protein [Flavipsychrobacter sp.]